MTKKEIGGLSVLMAAGGYTYFVVTTLMGTGDGASFSTFGLWATLAWITYFTMRRAGADATVPFVYGVGATVLTAVLVYKDKFAWSGFDTTVAICVAICVYLWMTRGPYWAIVMSVVACQIAAVPFLIMTWQHPENSPIVPNVIFFFANTLMCVSGKAWTVPDRLFSSVNIVTCAALVFPWLLFR